MSVARRFKDALNDSPKSELDLALPFTKENLSDLTAIAKELLGAEKCLILDLASHEQPQVVCAAGGDWAKYEQQILTNPTSIFEAIFSDEHPHLLDKQNPIFEELTTKFYNLTPHSYGLPVFIKKKPVACFVVVFDSPQKIEHLDHFTSLLRGRFDFLWARHQMDVKALQFEQTRKSFIEQDFFFQQFVQTLKQTFWIFDLRRNQISFVSRNLRNVMGVDPALLTGGPDGFLRLLAPQDKDRVTAEFHQLNDFDLDTEFRVVTAEAELRWIWLRVFPSAHSEAIDEATRLVFVADDITEKKVLEELQRDREADLASRVQMSALSELSHGISYEFRPPLSEITEATLNLGHALKQIEKLDNTVPAHLAKIQSATVGLTKIIDHIEAFGLKKQDNTKSLMSLESFFQDLDAFYADKFLARGIRYERHEIPADVKIAINEWQLQQAFSALLENSYEAVSEQKGSWIRIENTVDNDSIFISVTDSGSGIPLAIRSKVFEPFFTTKKRGQNAGLGLSLAQLVAHEHGGVLALDQLNLHTRLVFQLPLRSLVKN